MGGASVTTLWLVPAERPRCVGIDPTAEELESWSGLQGQRAVQVRWSRSWLRRCLANHFSVPPQQVPLRAPPGSPPSLALGWGHVSFSHCPDALAIAWSDQPIGVDVERLDRAVPAWALAQRFFCKEDQEELRGLAATPLRRAVLRQWVAKEAAIKWDRGSLAQDLGFWSCRSTADVAVHQLRGCRVPVQRREVEAWCLAVVGPAAGQTGPTYLV